MAVFGVSGAIILLRNPKLSRFKTSVVLVYKVPVKYLYEVLTIREYPMGGGGRNYQSDMTSGNTNVGPIYVSRKGPDIINFRHINIRFNIN
jgi:hypothetical protein